MDGTSQAGVKGTDDAHDFKRIIFIPYLGAGYRLFHRAWISIIIPGRGVPGSGHDALVVGDLVILDLYPLPQSAPRPTYQPHP